MLSFYKVIENAYRFIENRDLIAYLYGGDGRICTEEYFEQWLKSIRTGSHRRISTGSGISPSGSASMTVRSW